MPSAKPASGLRISVSDTGIGIRPSLLPRLFEPFTQAEPSATRSHGGLGIGLALARRLAESHGGRIWAESEGEGKGSTFHLELPLDMPQTSEVLSKE
ncbi:MAG: hypothetical protein HND47_24260 [Chloroflexi bacterium]|nr:hypothetical protein [Chloroflexota bacterium]